MKTTLAFLGIFIIGLMYLHLADKRDEAMMKMWDKCIYVEDINGVIHCTDN